MYCATHLYFKWVFLLYMKYFKAVFVYYFILELSKQIATFLKHNPFVRSLGDRFLDFLLFDIFIFNNIVQIS